MKIGDLVEYGNDRDYGVGIVVKVEKRVAWAGVTVRWSNGVESKHSAHWIIRVLEGA